VPVTDLPFQLAPASRFTIEQLTAAYNQTRVDYLVPMPMNAARLAEYIQHYDVDLERSAVALADEQMLGLGMLGWGLSEGLGGLHHGDRPRRVVVGAVVDAVAVHRPPHANVVHMRAQDHVFPFQLRVASLEDTDDVGCRVALDDADPAVHVELRAQRPRREGGSGLGGAEIRAQAKSPRGVISPDSSLLRLRRLVSLATLTIVRARSPLRAVSLMSRSSSSRAGR